MFISQTIIVIKELVKNNKVMINKDLSLKYLNDDESLYIETCKNFLKYATDIIAELIIYIENKDYLKVFEIVHRIKGFSIYIGSKQLYDFGDYICIKIRKIKQENLFKINKKLDDEIKLFYNYLKLIIEYKRKEIDDVL